MKLVSRPALLAFVVTVMVAAPFVWAQQPPHEDKRAGETSPPVQSVTTPMPPSPTTTPRVIAKRSPAEGANAFLAVHKVLTSPRCQNCHPAGDAPLHGEHGQHHPMLIRRGLEDVGLACASCHRPDPIGGRGTPPGAANWGLPPKATPMVFEGRSPRALCEQLTLAEHTGGRDLPALLHHVEHDALVLWGWNPGVGRSLPPLTHAKFVDAFTTWVGSGGACPP